MDKRTDIFSDLVPIISPLIESILTPTETLVNPFIKNAKPMDYKVITLSESQKIKIEKDQDEIILLLEGEEGKMFRIRLDKEAISEIQALEKVE